MDAKLNIKSDLFGIISQMGLLCTEERQIRLSREKDDKLFAEYDLAYNDINRIGYYYPNVCLPLGSKDYIEMWYGDEYINPAFINWIEYANRQYAVLYKDYDPEVNVRAYYNTDIAYRESIISLEKDIEYTYEIDIDVSDPKYSALTDKIYSCSFYISNSKIIIPVVTQVSDTVYRFTCKYINDIDFFICYNLVNVSYIKVNQGTYIDNSYSTNCYHRIIVDNDPTYPIDARFYPCITTDKDCTVRVYNDSVHKIQYPDVCRLVNYEEFIDIIDPYQSDNEYLKNLKPVDDVIDPNDIDTRIIQKFKRIAAYAYRCWEKFPYDSYLQSDFIICDNTKALPIQINSFTPEGMYNYAFIYAEVHIYTEKLTKIISNVPYEPYRDLLIYDGAIFNDYTVVSLKKIRDIYTENKDTGIPTYVIDSSYDIDKFSIIKFNTLEDTNFINIGEYIDLSNVAHLHNKLNRFYRNLMTVRMQFFNRSNEDKVRVMTKQPTERDRYMWFELILNVVPEIFEEQTVPVIKLLGLNEDSIPEEIANGAYSLDIDPKAGPTEYTDMMMTYFNLTRAKKDYLALQYGDGIEDPRVQDFRKINIGFKEDHQVMNELLIEDTGKDVYGDKYNYTEEHYEYGKADAPFNDGKVPGDLYAQLELDDPPPEEKIIHIREIEMGPHEPTDKSGDRFWIDATGNDYEGYRKDSMDCETESIDFVNDPKTIKEPKRGDYAVDSIDNTFDHDETISINKLVDDTDDQYDESIIDELDDILGDLDESTEVDGSPVGLSLGSISEVIARGLTVDNIADPKVGQIALDDLGFITSDGDPITMDEIAVMPKEEKLNVVHKLLTDDDTPDSTKVNIGDLWIGYLSTSDDDVLNNIVYNILLTEHVYKLHEPEHGTLAIEGDTMPEETATLAYGDYPKWTYEHEMIIEHVGIADEGSVIPESSTIREANVHYIMSVYEPDNPEQDDLWVNIPAATLQDYVKDVISKTLMDFGLELPNEAYYNDDGYSTYASMGFDYVPHDKHTEGVGEVFQEYSDSTLRNIYYGETLPDVELEQSDIWYEFLDTIDNKVCYSDPNTMVLRINEKLYAVTFDHNNIQSFAFDDIFINFNGNMSVRYMSILADLINSGKVSLDEVNIFYKRLITVEDDFDPRMQRLYTGMSHVVSTAKVEPIDYYIHYSTNVKRYTIDYSNNENITHEERESLYRMCIDLRAREFIWLQDKMAIFVNGKYINRKNIEEIGNSVLHIKNFNEIIRVVDIFYSDMDEALISLKRATAGYIDQSINIDMISRPSRYDVMKPIVVRDYSYRGYYDVLLTHYIFNGKLMRLLRYLEENKDESEEAIRDIIRKFHEISDIINGISDKEARIIINTSNTGDYRYLIGNE